MGTRAREDSDEDGEKTGRTRSEDAEAWGQGNGDLGERGRKQDLEGKGRFRPAGKRSGKLEISSPGCLRGRGLTFPLVPCHAPSAEASGPASLPGLRSSLASYTCHTSSLFVLLIGSVGGEIGSAVVDWPVARGAGAETHGGAGRTDSLRVRTAPARGCGGRWRSCERSWLSRGSSTSR